MSAGRESEISPKSPTSPTGVGASDAIHTAEVCQTGTFWRLMAVSAVVYAADVVRRRGRSRSDPHTRERKAINFPIFMSSPRLPSYLRTHRKRSALSQRELAYLLGATSGSKISRCERRVRYPDFETALAFHVIFRTTVPALFPGALDKVRRRVRRRARRLARELGEGPRDPVRAKKIAFLNGIARSRPRRDAEHP